MFEGLEFVAGAGLGLVVLAALLVWELRRGTSPLPPPECAADAERAYRRCGGCGRRSHFRYGPGEGADVWCFSCLRPMQPEDRR